MTTRLKNLFLLLALIGLGLMPPGRLTAQTFTTLYSFTNGSDGEDPVAGLVLSGNTLYGTVEAGGTLPAAAGSVFALNTDGTGFAVLHPFVGYSNDGSGPKAGLVLSGNTLYGTAYDVATGYNGTVFAVNTNGSDFTVLDTISNSINGMGVAGGLVLSGNTLYGTATYGGKSGSGTVFAVNTDGSDFTVLYSFTADPSGTNSEGANPEASLLLSGNTLYGTACHGGSSGNGTVFAFNTDNSSFTTLHSFTALTGGANSDGAYPVSGLILSGNLLYGTASGGGSWGGGTVFAINTNDMSFTTVHSFGSSAPSDGNTPLGGLILSGNTLYGTTYYGGSSHIGMVFAVNTDGTAFTNLYSFTGLSDGRSPAAGLILSGDTLYGTTSYPEINLAPGNPGTVFALSLAPSLGIAPTGNQVVLSWPGWAPAFALQTTTNLVSPRVWTTNSTPPAIVNGQFTVTNSISGTKQFYRLSQ
jgi:uncharacterized repeat protein (TIGR03803 family)